MLLEDIIDKFEFLKVQKEVVELDNSNAEKKTTMRSDIKFRLLILMAVIAIISCIISMTIGVNELRGDEAGWFTFAQLIVLSYIIVFTWTINKKPTELQKLNQENEILKKQIEQVELKRKLEEESLVTTARIQQAKADIAKAKAQQASNF